MVVVVAALFLLPVAIFFAVQHPKAQQRLVHEATQLLSEKFNTTVSVSSVQFRLFNRLVLNDVYVQDLKGDTLFYAGEAALSLSRIRLAEKYVEASRLALSDVNLSLRRDTAGVLNLKFIIDGLKNSKADTVPKPNTDGASYSLKLSRLTTNDLSFSFVDSSIVDTTLADVVSYNSLIINELHVDLREVNVNGDTITCLLEELKLRERSGFNLHRMSGRVSVAPTFIEVKNLQVLDDYSDVRARHYRMDFDSFSDFFSYVERVRMSADFTSAKVDLYTIGFFTKKMPRVHLPLNLTGRVEGTVASLKGRELDLNYGENTDVKLNFSMMGLPDVQGTFFTFDAKELTSVPQDILLADSAVLNKKIARHAELLRQLGTLSGHARFTGFLSNFVANGELATDKGTIISDLAFSPAPDSAMAISGTLGTENFDLGSILNDSIVGRLSLHGKASGTVKSFKNISLNLDVDMPLLELKNYPYRATKVKGLLTERSFSGALSCRDKNLDFDFRGSIDFEKEKSLFDFNLNLRHADLFKLHLVSHDSISRLSLTATAEAEGSNLDDFTGKLRVSNVKYAAHQRAFFVDTMRLNAKKMGEVKSITLTSDLLNATLQAKGGLSHAPATLNHVVGYYLPVFSQLLADENLKKNIADTTPKPALNENAEYTFSLLIKKAQAAFSVLTPQLELADSTEIRGRIATNVQRTQLSLRTDSARVGQLKLKNFSLRSAVRDSLLQLTAKVDSATNGNLDLQKINLSSTLKAGRAELKSSYKTSIASGNLNAAAQVFRDAQGGIGVDVALDSSQVVLGDTAWHLSPSKLRYEKGNIAIQYFKVENGSQIIYANGFISNSLKDSLRCDVNGVSIAPLLQILGAKTPDITGTLSGKLKVNGVLSQSRDFFANVKASNVFVEKMEVGNLTLNSFSEQGEKDVSVQLRVERGGAEALSVGGVVKPSGEILAAAKLSGVNLDYLNPLLEGPLSDVGGAVSGNLKVMGQLKQPLLNGKLQVENGTLRVNILNTLYRLSGEVLVENSSLHMRDWQALDDKNTTSRANFSLYNVTQPDKIHFTLKVAPENFHVLNSMARRNENFYGQGYATGVVQINGGQGEVEVSAVATTNENTQVSIPLSGAQSAQQSNFIDFVTPVSGQNAKGKTKKNQLEAASNVKVDLDFRVTPDAELQLVLNENTGDVIKAAGNGDVKLEVQPASNIFRVFGAYTLQRGEYAVSIQNLFNLKFKINSGSVINFNGDIDAATADIQANYKQLRVPLAGLFDSTANVNNRYSRPVPINCGVHITGRLTAPTLKFSIEAPTVDVETRTLMQTRLNTDDDIVTQFMSLVLTGQFVPTDEGLGAMVAGGIGGSTLSNFLSAQLSGMLSQAFEGINVSVKVPTVGAQSAAEQDWGATFSLNPIERLSISGGVGQQHGRDVANPNNASMVYDADVEYTLDAEGKWRVKMFSHADNQYAEMMQTTGNRYGVGVVYQESFDSFTDLWQAIFRKKE
jgi:hypothetical protein